MDKLLELVLNMEIKDWIALMSAAVALSAFIFTLLSNRALNRRERINLYIELKKKFYEIYKNFPVSFTDETIPKNKEERLILYGYWHHCFDEWYVTNKIGGQREKRELWSRYFEPVILRSLTHGALREAFVYNYEVEKTHDEPRLEFFEKIAKRYSKKYGRNVFEKKSDLLYSLINEWRTRVGIDRESIGPDTIDRGKYGQVVAPSVYFLIARRKASSPGVACRTREPG